MKSSCCLAYKEFIAIPATSFVDNFRHLRANHAVLVRNAGFNAARVLKYNFEVDSREEFVYTGFQMFSDLVAVTSPIYKPVVALWRRRLIKQLLNCM